MKLNQLYNEQAFKAFADSAVSEVKAFCDAPSNGVVMARSLEAIDPKVLQTRYPEFAFFNSGLTISNVGGYANTITSLRGDMQGRFKKTTDKDTSKGRFTASAEKSSIQVDEFTAQAMYTFTEIKQAMLENRNIVQDYIRASDRAYKLEIEESIIFGVNGTSGLANHADIEVTPSLGDITAGTGLNAYQAIADFLTTQHSEVNNIPQYMVNVAIMPTDIYNWLRKTLLNEKDPSVTVLSSLQRNFGDMKFMQSHYLSNIGGHKTICAFSTNEEVAKIRIPVPMTRSQVYTLGFNHYHDAMFRLGGIDILEPAGCVIGQFN